MAMDHTLRAEIKEARRTYYEKPVASIATTLYHEISKKDCGVIHN